MQLATLLVFVLLQVSRPDGTVATANVDYAAPGGSGVPAGAILLINSGSCPSGYTEVVGLSGKFLLGTVAANADVGTTGGSDTVTPTFTGTAFTSVINHTHAVDVIDPGHTHLTQRYPTTTGGSSGFTFDTSMSGTLADNTLPTKTATTGVTATSQNPAGGVASITPAGAISEIDKRPAFTRVIFCKKD